jgi:DNA-binding beta-propeller fold protein YncE
MIERKEGSMNRQAQEKLASTALAAGFLLVLASGPAPAAEPATLELVGTISLKGAAGRLDHLALDRKHARLFVANLSNNSLDIVDLKAGKLIKQVPDQKKIQGIAYAPDLDRIYVGNGTSGECNVFDGKDYTLLKSIKLPGADNVRYLARHHLVYVGHAEKALSAIDAQTFEVKAEIPLPGRPEGFQLETKRPRLYMNTVEPTRLVAIDTDKNEVLKRYPLKLADRAYPMAVDEAHHRLFLGCRTKPSIVVVDSETGTEVTSIAIPEDIDDLFYDAKNKRLYASCGAGSLAVVRQRDPDHYESLETIRTAKMARTCFFDSVGERLYLIVPRQEGEEGPMIRVYRPRN